MKPDQAPFNTAVFYDIENLLGGYSFNAQWVAELSLKDILTRIRASGLTGRIAVQRAYANWSDPRLGILRNEINELGIDPIQIFGFSRDAKRNAADIQLAIDAIDLAHLRPAIGTFVIVSGDGGFASLAKKLHEYGRTVIGAAYRKATNQTLRAVCDDFVWIETSDEDEEPAKIPKPAKPKPAPAVPSAQTPASAGKSTEAAVAAVPKLSMTAGRDAVLATARKVIKEIAKQPLFKSMLDQEGIPTTVLGQAFHQRVEDMDYPQLGFPKLRDLVRYLCTGTDWQIARGTANGTTEYLIRRNRLKDLKGWEAHPDLSDSDFHSEAYYLAILAKGEPMIRIPDSSSLRALVACLSENPPRGIPLAAAIELVAEDLQGKVPAETIRYELLTLLNVGAFIREPENMPLLEQTLTLRDTWINPVDAYNQVRDAAREKILRMLGKIDDAIFDRIL